MGENTPMENSNSKSASTRLLTKNELAIQLGVSPRTIETWVACRRIPVYKFGRRCVRFDLQEVREALRHFRVEASVCGPKASNTQQSAHFCASSGSDV